MKDMKSIGFFCAVTEIICGVLGFAGIAWLLWGGKQIALPIGIPGLLLCAALVIVGFLQLITASNK